MSAETELPISAIGEFPLIARLRSRFDRAGGGVVRGMGDDTAVLRVRPGWVVLATTDALVEDVHFRRATTTAAILGRRALAVNLSDIASMGGEPRWVLISIALPGQTSLQFFDELAAGLAEEAERYGATIVGGNLATSLERITVDVTLLGEVEAGRAVYRNGARPGDRVLVTGTLGDSAAGLELLQGTLQAPVEEAADLIARHRSPTPRVAAGRAIAGTGGATAMIDVSDGLASDLGHILDASGVGATIEATKLPLSAALRHVARLAGRDPLGWATRGGEDYELLTTVTPRLVKRTIEAVEATGISIAEIGEITTGSGSTLLLPDARQLPLQGTLWQHFGTNRG